MARQPFDIDIIRPDALSPADRQAWDAFRAADPRLTHPYLDWRYVEAAAAVPGAALAVFRRDGRVAGYFPFQRRGRLIQPLGAPLTDYHGAVADRDTGLTPDLVAQALGATLRVGGWVTSDGGEGFQVRRRMAADVSGGATALEAACEARNHKFWKNLRRLERAFERDHGPVEFVWDDRDPAVLDWIVTEKRAQYRRTRRHDVFACGWTETLLRRLFQLRTEGGGYGLRLSSLRDRDGRMAAAEASLDDGTTLHMWFPVFDPVFARCGPGMLLTWKEMQAAAADGYALVDFGSGDEGYKTAFAEARDPVLVGVAMGGRPPIAPKAGHLLREAGSAPLRRLGDSLGRRLDVIDACATTRAEWWSGAAAAALAAARKAARKTAGATA